VAKRRLKGGSLSGTYLMDDGGAPFVRKDVSLTENREYGFQRWYSQMKRLQRLGAQFPGVFPRFLRVGQDGDKAYFDLEYIDGAVTVVDYLRGGPGDDGVAACFESLWALMERLHSMEIPSSAGALRLFLQEEVVRALGIARTDRTFDEFSRHEAIDLNGEEIVPLHRRIAHLFALADEHYVAPRECFTHGNITLENLLYVPATRRVVFIDPYEENVVDSRLHEYSQLLQSCHSYYEVHNEGVPHVDGAKVTLRVPSVPGLDRFFELLWSRVRADHDESDQVVIRIFEMSSSRSDDRPMKPLSIRMGPGGKAELRVIADSAVSEGALRPLPRPQGWPMPGTTPNGVEDWDEVPVDVSDLKSWLVRTELPVSFLVKSTRGILDPGNPELLSVGAKGPGARRLVVIDKNVHDLYGAAVERYFDAQEVCYRTLSVESTESTKTLDSTMKVLEAMEGFAILRQSEPVIAIGGGVLLDVVGLACSLYRRGVPYIRVPTSLLALVDASVGAKTGVNHFGRRNRLGSYTPPAAVYLDRGFLRTLDDAEMRHGLAEILKLAIVKDRELFCLLEAHGPTLIREKFQNDAVAVEVINRAIQGMIEELEPNLWEKHLQRVVDFGHSFSPLVEMRALPELPHGQAVALDCVFSAILSCHRGLLSRAECDRVVATTRALGLPTFHPLFGAPELLEEALADTVRHRNGAQNLPLPVAIGESRFFHDVTREEIARAAATMATLT
jgi:3-dehydroquinate synthase